ncbi:MAG: DUF4347 domain-containing protein [Thermodesulfobacteriota bacterium]
MTLLTTIAREFELWFTRSPRILHRPMMLEPLEERIVLDAAISTVTQDNQTASQASAFTDATHHSTSTAASQTTHDQQTTTDSGSLTDSSAASAKAAATVERTAQATTTVTTADQTAQSTGKQGTVASTSDQVSSTGTSQTEDSQGLRVLLVSSSVEGAQDLITAAKAGVITIRYDAVTDTPATLIEKIEDSLQGQKAESLAIASHDLGAGRFKLTGGLTVAAESLEDNHELRDFWAGMGRLLTEDGRIDILACDVAKTGEGLEAISLIETLSGHTVAASTDATGNSSSGGDWILETRNVDVSSLYFVAEQLAGFEITLASESKCTASDGAADDLFGYGVSIYGNTAVVGAQFDDGAKGSAYVYQNTGGGWVQTAKLVASDRLGVDYFGIATSYDGTTALIGAYYGDKGLTADVGAAYIYQAIGGVWTETQKLTPSDGANQDGFGRGLWVSGDYAIVGSFGHDLPGKNEAGAAYIYHYQAGTWVEVQKLTASDAASGDWFGYSVWISGDTAVVGAKYADVSGKSDAGAVYVYSLVGGVWVEEQKLTASDASAGDYFGQYVASSGDWLVVGADGADPSGKSSAGAGYVFELQSGTWVETQKLVPSDAGAGDRFGRSLSIDGDIAVVSAYRHDVSGKADAGAAYVFRLDCTSGTWVQTEELTASDYAADDEFGTSVSIQGLEVIAGAPADLWTRDANGAAYVYVLDPSPT